MATICGGLYGLTKSSAVLFSCRTAARSVFHGVRTRTGISLARTAGFHAAQNHADSGIGTSDSESVSNPREGDERSKDRQIVQKCDLLVVGSGGAGMTAALTAQHLGLSVIVAEKEEQFGGATARSGGWLWVPQSSLAKEAGIQDGAKEALAYIEHEAGPYFDRTRAEAYVDAAPEMLDFVIKTSPVRFQLFTGMPDYHPDSPGASLGGRCVYTKAWDATPMGKDLDRLRRPLQSMTAFGMQVGNEDLTTFMTAARKVSSFVRVLRLLAGNMVDGLLRGQSLRITSGRALVGGLASAATAKGAEIWTSSPVRRLLTQDGCVVGAVLQRNGQDIQILARRGVVLASGGFAHDTQLRNQLLGNSIKDVATNSAAWGLLPYGVTGDGIRMAKDVAGKFQDNVMEPIAYSPVTRAIGAEGDLSLFPVFIGRAVPGQICVTRSGRRFISEGCNYHAWGEALVKATQGDEETAAWFVCDHRALKRYGMAAVAPWPMPYGKFLRTGYLKRADTIRELAETAGIDPDGLEDEVKRFNTYAREGRDPDYGRGENAYDLVNGDQEHTPNPCLGSLAQGPFYAIKALAGCGSTHAGLATDKNASVLRNDGSAITGLYAVGNDAAAVTGGKIIAGGITIGPGMTFGYLAARHAARGTVQ